MKAQKKFNYNTYNNELSVKERLYTIPIIITMCVLPFIVRYKEYSTKLSNFMWFGDSKTYVDLFLYYKQFIFIGITITVLILLIHKIIVDKIFKLPKSFYYLLAYNLLLIISTLISPYRYWGIHGVFEQFESLIVHVGYLAIVIYCMNVITNVQQIKIIIKFFVLSGTVMLIIGLFQGLGLDVISSDFSKSLIFPPEIFNNLLEFNMAFPKGMIYTTLYNPNYMGVYLALIMPIIFGMIFCKGKKYYKIALVLLFLIAIFNLIKSDSAAGIITLIITITVAMVFILYKFLNNKKIFYGIISVLVCAILILGYTNRNKINKIFMNGTQTSANLEQIITAENLEITYLNTILRINYTVESEKLIFTFTDSQGNLIDYIFDADEGYYSLKMEGFERIRIEPVIYNELYSCLITIDNIEWCFTNQTKDGNFYYINNYGKLVKLIHADNFIDKKYDKFVSGRGYIWSRTLPLLKNFLFLGSGADSFVFVFPHYDYVGTANSGFLGQIINKPHSLYLQIGIHSGVLALVIYILFFIIYIFSSFNIYLKCSMNEWNHIIGFALFLSVFSYLVISLANDSSITVTPIFWCLVGISLCMNRLLAKCKN